jgi:hypothetical protein
MSNSASLTGGPRKLKTFESVLYFYKIINGLLLATMKEIENFLTLFKPEKLKIIKINTFTNAMFKNATSV